jgi:hypothetical protein
MTAQNPQTQLPDRPPAAELPPRPRRPAVTNHAIRFFGGPPLSVVVRLILLSILVGVVLHASGLDPWNILDSIRRFVISIWNMGFDAVRWVWRYFLLGAVIVLPIWLIVRLVRAPTERG